MAHKYASPNVKVNWKNETVARPLDLCAIYDAEICVCDDETDRPICDGGKDHQQKYLREEPGATHGV
jgi:hypothetical protein